MTASAMFSLTVLVGSYHVDGGGRLLDGLLVSRGGLVRPDVVYGRVDVAHCLQDALLGVVGGVLLGDVDVGVVLVVRLQVAQGLQDPVPVDLERLVGDLLVGALDDDDGQVLGQPGQLGGQLIDVLEVADGVALRGRRVAALLVDADGGTDHGDGRLLDGAEVSQAVGGRLGVQAGLVVELLGVRLAARALLGPRRQLDQHVPLPAVGALCPAGLLQLLEHAAAEVHQRVVGELVELPVFDGVGEVGVIAWPRRLRRCSGTCSGGWPSAGQGWNASSPWTVSAWLPRLADWQPGKCCAGSSQPRAKLGALDVCGWHVARCRSSCSCDL